MTTVLAPAPARHRAAAPAVRPAPGPRPAPRPAPRRGEPARPHLRVVRPEERRLRRLSPAGGVVLTVLLFAVLAGLAGAHSVIAQGQIRLDRLDAEVRAEQARYQQLRRDVAVMESPERVVAAAEAQGMVTPGDLVYLQPAGDDIASGELAADGRSASGAAARDDSGAASPPATGSWSTVKPMLETSAP